MSKDDKKKGKDDKKNKKLVLPEPFRRTAVGVIHKANVTVLGPDGPREIRLPLNPTEGDIRAAFTEQYPEMPEEVRSEVVKMLAGGGELHGIIAATEGEDGKLEVVSAAETGLNAAHAHHTHGDVPPLLMNETMEKLLRTIGEKQPSALPIIKLMSIVGSLGDNVKKALSEVEGIEDTEERMRRVREGLRIVANDAIERLLAYVAYLGGEEQEELPISPSEEASVTSE